MYYVNPSPDMSYYSPHHIFEVAQRDVDVRLTVGVSR